MRSIPIFFSLFFLSLGCLAQAITGKVTDSLKQPIANANIILKNNGIIVSYVISNSRGEYVLPKKEQKNSAFIVEVTCIGFKKQQTPYSTLRSIYNFILAPDVHQLETVTVKNSKPYLRQKGDTLSYLVSDFSNLNDRVIGDVIKRMPGIEVATDGKISYNGKAISNFYIDGDDLLDDRYNIATRSIPQNAVDKVQIYENHQPVKLLRDKTPTGEVALNLSIKEEARFLMGQESIGAGTPEKYFADLNAMLFKRKYKAINSLKANNIGIDLEEDIISHNLVDYLNRTDNTKPGSLISLGLASSPDLPRSRYLLNQSGLLNLNNLVNLKNEVQLKLNGFYMLDQRRQVYKRETAIVLPTGTISYTEEQQSRVSPNVFQGQMTLDINRAKYFLKNVLLLRSSSSNAFATSLQNDASFDQHQNSSEFDLSNELRLMKKTKSGNVLEFYSYLNRYNNPETRIISPGILPDLFNQNIGYNLLLQDASIPNWTANQFVTFRLQKGIFHQEYKTGIFLQSQKLNSSLDVVDGATFHAALPDSSMNRLSWQRLRLLAEATFSINTEKIRVSLTVPLNFRNVKYRDDTYLVNSKSEQLYVNPDFFLKYKLGRGNNIQMGYNYKNDIGTVEDAFRGYILSSFNFLKANNAPINQRRVHTGNLSYNYRKTLSLFFASLGILYNRTENSNINSSFVTPTVQRLVVLPFENNSISWTFNGRLSKYVFPMHTTVAAGLSWQIAQNNLIQNGTLLPVNSNAPNLRLHIESKVSQQFNLSYEGNFTKYISKIKGAENSLKTNQINNKITFSYLPTALLSFNLTDDLRYYVQDGMKSNTYNFMDVTTKYRFTKLGFDLELQAVNLWHVKSYRTVSLADLTSQTTSYLLPGRTILLKVNFNL
ncbi:hypothetical protein H9X96_21470 [Pedobacter sp. N36a]|uniref:carboxypeptidase-like regulatory domain-containing protein n=1 Tax=Pedobacter sp. N36a TaxID=2767996 RepID=UPI001657053C|nr:carboxypeptidase-like regulatory domain-containing protein [Pedobacter sp. N36a]MBC8988330.1 hypothetical protein [Pedobacter sp. N36a]